MARQRSVETRENDVKALAMRRSGLSLRQIADQLGFKSTSSAHDAVRRALKDCFRDEVDDAVQVELERLDDALRVTYRIMMARHIKVSTTGVIVRDANGQPVLDDALNYQAAMGLKALSESRRKLLGLDAPTKTRVQVITDDDLDDEIKKLNRELAGNDDNDRAGVAGETR